MSELNTAPETRPTRRDKLLAQYNTAFGKHAELIGKMQELKSKMQELAAEIHSIDALASVTVGDGVIVTVGRGEEAKAVEARVVGIREEEDGSKTYKVTYGSGFDAEIAVVKGSKLTPMAAAPTCAE